MKQSGGPLTNIHIIIITTIPLLFGAVQPVVWSIYAGVIFCVFIFDLWREKPGFDSLSSPLPVLSVGVFFIFTLLQVAPVPARLLESISPVKFENLTRAAVLMENSPLGQVSPLGHTSSYFGDMSSYLGHTISYVPAVSFAWWVFLLSLFLFFVVVQRRLDTTRNLLWITGAMLGIALFESIYGLIQALIPSVGVLWVDYIPSYLGDARGTFINRNHFAGFIEMVWPLGLGLIIAMTHRWREERYPGAWQKKWKVFLSSDRIGLHLFLVSALMFMLLALLFSRSRAGIAGALIGFAVFVILVHAGGKRMSAPAWAGMGMGFCFLLIYGNAIGFDQLIGRIMAIDESAGSRMNIWINTIHIIRDHPFGIGLGNFEGVMPAYNSLGPYGIKFTHAHNDYLQLLAEAGWPGFVALTGGFLVFMGNAVRRIRKFGAGLDPARFYIGVGACSGLVSIAFHSIFDFNLQIPANMLYFVVLLAIANGCFRKN